jgi:hypothetical protein
MAQETLSFRGTMKGHVGWVCAIATGSLEAPDTVVSAGRDKSLISWNLTRDGENYGVPHRRMNGYVCTGWLAVWGVGVFGFHAGAGWREGGDPRWVDASMMLFKCRNHSESVSVTRVEDKLFI